MVRLGDMLADILQMLSPLEGDYLILVEVDSYLALKEELETDYVLTENARAEVVLVPRAGDNWVVIEDILAKDDE